MIASPCHSVGIGAFNDLHRASGGCPQHRHGHFLRNKQAAALVAELGGTNLCRPRLDGERRCQLKTQPLGQRGKRPSGERGASDDTDSRLPSDDPCDRRDRSAEWCAEQFTVRLRASTQKS